MSRRWPRGTRVGSPAGQRTSSGCAAPAAPASGDCSGADLALEVLRDALEILHEGAELELAGLFIGCAEDRRGMHGRHHRRQTGSLDELAALQAHPEVATEERLGGGRSEQDK